MLARLRPLQVLAYGPLPYACYDLVPVIEYPTRWQNIRRARRDSFQERPLRQAQDKLFSPVMKRPLTPSRIEASHGR